MKTIWLLIKLALLNSIESATTVMDSLLLFFEHNDADFVLATLGRAD